MQDKVVRVGIVGLGLVATSHLKGYLAHPSAEVVAVCDSDNSRARQFADMHGIAEFYSSFEDMLENSDIDAIDIATPTFLHSVMTLKAAKAGKHVHCEKPFCRTTGEGMAACRAARSSGIKLVVGETYVFGTSHMKARELIDEGVIGRPLQVRQRQGAFLERSDPRIPTGPGDRTWRVDPEKSGGGEYPWVYDHAVHFFSVGEYLMQDHEIAEIYGVSSSHVPGNESGGAAHDPYTSSHLDIPIITWKYEDSDRQGLWVRGERLNGKYDYMQGFSSSVVGEKGLIEVLGEGGHNLLWEGKQCHLVLHREGKEAITYRFDEGGDDVWQSDLSYYSQGHINQIRHFVDSIIQDIEPRYSGEQGVHAVQCVLATIRSAREGRPVKVKEIGPDYSAY